MTNCLAKASARSLPEILPVGAPGLLMDELVVLFIMLSPVVDGHTEAFNVSSQIVDQMDVILKEKYALRSLQQMDTKIVQVQDAFSEIGDVQAYFFKSPCRKESFSYTRSKTSDRTILGILW